MALETNKTYDKIVGTIMQNVIAESNLAGGKVVLWDFHPENTVDRLYYYVACIIADLYDKQMYLEMTLWKFIKFKFKNRKRKNIHWVNRRHTSLPPECQTSVFIIMECVREFYGIDINMFDDINKEYYENINN